jgi:hypothetical protein
LSLEEVAGYCTGLQAQADALSLRLAGVVPHQQRDRFIDGELDL